MYNRNQYSCAYSRRRYSNLLSTETTTSAAGSTTSFHVNTSANDRSMGDVEIQVISEPTGHFKEDVAPGEVPYSSYTPVGGRIYAKGTVLLVKACPYTGYKFVSWQSATYIPSSAHQQRSFQIVVNRDMTFIANFERIPGGYAANHTLSVYWDDARGRVNANGLQDGQMTVPYGTQVTLTAVPKDGYVFSRWSGLKIAGNAQSNASKTITITMPNRDISLTAEFAKVVDNPGGGGGTPGGDHNKDTDSPVVDLETETTPDIATGGGIVEKAVPFVKKWWWAIAIVAYLVWKERKGGSK